MIVSARGLGKKYGAHRALEGVSFELPDRGVTALLGPNGAGKTTLLRILTCFHAPTEGTFLLGGTDGVDHPAEIKARLRYLPEQGPVWPDMTVEENLSFTAALHGLKGPAKAKSVKANLERFALGDRRRQLARHLSKGLRQRVALGAALCGNPDLVVLDEPTSGLDPNQVHEFRQILSGIARETSVLVSSHILAEAEQTGDRFLVLHQGRLVQATDREGLRSLKGHGLRVVLAEALSPSVVEGVQVSLSLERVEVDGKNLLIRDARLPGLTPELVRQLAKAGAEILEVGRPAGALESLFQSLTLG